MTFSIASIKYRLGEKLNSVEELCLISGQKYERLILRSGFQFVHRTLHSEEKFFSDFLNEELVILENDFVIFVNQSMACKIPGKLPILFSNHRTHREVGFLEISDGCTGFLRAFLVANSFIESGFASRVHIICAEKYSQYYGDHDVSVSPIFSDAISSTTLTNHGSNKIIGSKILNFFESSEAISVRKMENLDEKLVMEGARVLTWATREIPKIVQELLGDAKLRVEEIDSWFVHQGSKIVVHSIMESLGVNPDDKFTSSQIGNTVSSTIPIMLTEKFEEFGREYIPKGYSMFLGFGVGLSIVAVLVEVSE